MKVKTGQRSPRMAEAMDAFRAAQTAPRRAKALTKLQGLIERRIEFLEKSYGVKNLHRWQYTISPHADNLDTLLEDPQFLAITKPPMEAALALGTVRPCIYAQNDGMMDALVLKDRLIFKNPFSDTVESWARPFAAEGLHYHCYPARRTATKSVFLKGVNCKQVCCETFQASEPVGQLVGAAKLYMYKRFDRPIGELPGAGQPTNLVRIQCDRVQRPQQGDGYRTRVHGYPFSAPATRSDLGKCPQLLKMLS